MIASAFRWLPGTIVVTAAALGLLLTVRDAALAANGTGSWRLSNLIPSIAAMLFAMAALAATRQRWPQPLAWSFAAHTIMLVSGGTSVTHPMLTWLFAVSLAAIPPLVLHAYAVLFGESRHMGIAIRRVLGVCYVTACILILPTLLVPIGRLQTEPAFAPWRMGLYLAVIFAYVAAAFYSIRLYRDNASPVRRRGIRILAVCTLLSPVPAMVLSVLPTMLRSAYAIEADYTLIGMLLLPAGYLYVMSPLPARHGSAARLEGLVSLALLGTMFLVGQIYLSTALDWWSGQMLSPMEQLAVAGVVFLVAWSLRTRVSRFVRWLWHGREMPASDLMQWLAASLAVSLDIKALRNILTVQLPGAIAVSRAALYLAQPDGNLKLEAAHAADDAAQPFVELLPATGDLVRQLNKQREPLDIRVHAQGVAGSGSSRSGIPDTGWLIPLLHDDQMLGVLWVGRRTSSDWFTPQDVGVFVAISRQAGLALRNVLLVDQIKHQRDRLMSANELLILEREKERNRIARDLHDVVLQRAIGMGYQIKLQRLNIPSDDHPVPDAPLMLDRTAQALRDLSRDIRGVIADLRPIDWDAQGFEKALRDYVDQFAESMPHLSMARVSYAIDHVGWGHAGNVRLALFRIAQEALRNTFRHAHARAVSVSLRRLPGALELSVADDGRGLEQSPPTGQKTASDHFGLTGMRERAELAGGSLALEKTPGGGLTVRAIIPVEVSR